MPPAVSYTHLDVYKRQSHARVKVNLVVSREYARANQFTGMVHGHVPRLISPWVRSEMVTTEQHAVAGKPCMARRGVNKLGKLNWSLSRVTAQLIHLARGGFNVQNLSLIHI